MTVIVRTISRLLLPFMLLFGAYIVLHGHLTPGGGFPGGVVIAASVVMLALAYGVDDVKSKVSFLHAEMLESAGGILVVIIGVCGLLLGTFFLQNVFPLGSLGTLFSAGGLPLLYIGVGIKVAAGLILIFYAIASG
jgi:multicomponent Na+:H+ antiporter subunit B